MSGLTTPANELAIWHDVECGAYRADLRVWEELARQYPGPVLELGAGTGRVALTLARKGRAVTAVDHAPALLAMLGERARDADVRVETIDADVRDMDLGRLFGLVIAPMQLLQVLGDPAERAAALRVMRRHIDAGGAAAAAAIVPAGVETALHGAPADLLPDVREVDGWVYSSLAVAIDADGEAIEARRLRQRVSPDGELDEREHVDRLLHLDADELDAEAAAAGLRAVRRHLIPDDEAFVGATVCVWEAQE